MALDEALWRTEGKGLGDSFQEGCSGLETGIPGRMWDACFADSWGFPKFRGTFLGIPIIRTIVY